MKSWTTAEIAGRCAYDGKEWKAGERVFRVQGSTWAKTYCPTCAARHHHAPPDTGEILDVTDAPNFPAPLKHLAERAATAFDARMRAAGKDE